MLTVYHKQLNDLAFRVLGRFTQTTKNGNYVYDVAKLQEYTADRNLLSSPLSTRHTAIHCRRYFMFLHINAQRCPPPKRMGRQPNIY
jgi:hypothetical protein